jgi:hypothetical protein
MPSWLIAKLVKQQKNFTLPFLPARPQSEIYIKIHVRI